MGVDEQSIGQFEANRDRELVQDLECVQQGAEA